MSLTLDRRQLLGLGAALAGSRAIAADTAPPPAYGPEPGIAKLDANENPAGPSPAALAAIADASRSGGAYYVGAPARRLRAMIAERHGLTPDHVYLSPGSSVGIMALALAAAKHGDVLGPDLFFDYTAAVVERQGVARLRRLPRDPGLAIDLSALEAAVDDSISLVNVVNPNNPTGLLSDPDALREFCVRASRRARVLVDEAYNELLDDPTRHSMVPLVREGHDVVVARTFSKIHGLAGLRVGYLLAAPETLREISAFGVGPFGLNQAGIAAAIASYDDEAFLGESRAVVREGRTRVEAALHRAGLRWLPSQSNFVFVDLGDLDADLFRDAMAGRGVRIRGAYGVYRSWSRVSMGRLEDIDRYVAALPDALGDARAAAAQSVS